MALAPRTVTVYQRDGALRELLTKITSCRPVASLTEAERSFFKAAQDGDYVLATQETVFHPQGGGQPSDTGTITSTEHSGKETTFQVKLVRKLPEDRILHHGSFVGSPEKPTFDDGDTVLQTIDNEKRNYHSRLHTAGHIIGLAVRQLADSIPNVTELKANHAPDSAFVEFKGLIDGQHKPTIQKKATDLVLQNLPVGVRWWDEEKMRAHCTAVPDAVSMPEDGLIRVVEVEGVGAYPCGGTHLPTTQDIGGIVVRRISRQKGITKISYSITDKPQ
ncbi:ThrRS/AlaRS common domain-containing protein [Glonium stellatum]|uniref:ThrRS/AlaRS common domain-containing protein n=1 Tax=Glonium stellatum TaxID=574774 RepID=A0A8E2JQC2_9PEZI|nr:ThrRS/AlaRS common domain-containing protein [Glonium stellatum]